MTPDFRSQYTRREIPDNASKLALKLRDDYRLLKANIEACMWPHITSDSLRLDYNTNDGRVRITVGFTDNNKHSHTFSIISYGDERLQCEYEFEGGVDAPVASFRSYAEWLMLQLWQFDIDAELCKCDRGLVMPADIDSALNEYYRNENIEFCKTANAIMDLLTTWKALHIYGEESVYLNTYREHAFQKFCLFLDCMLSMKDNHEADKLPITPDIRNKREELEDLLGTQLEFAEDEDEKRIFTNGHFHSEPIKIEKDLDFFF